MRAVYHVELYKSSISSDTIRYNFLSLKQKKRMYHVQLYKFSISSDSQTLNFISLSQNNRNETSNMLSYTTELPMIIYSTEIICKRYKSTLKCSQSPHRQYIQYGVTQHRNHMLPHSFPHQYGRCTDEHVGRCDLVPFLCAKKEQMSSPWGPDS